MIRSVNVLARCLLQAGALGIFIHATPVSAQSCDPGPSCAKIGKLVQQYVAQPGGGAITNSAMKAYCINKVAAEASRECAAEFAASGSRACADLANRQMNEFLRTVASAQSTSANSSDEMQWKEKCGW